mmetsp:Transcript_26062/g.34204  ORF Transcript_26062/g.34204 Transcript_26062/m.34204 type:complete len:602 (-) Transcript_26062:87-1892(-)
MMGNAVAFCCLNKRMIRHVKPLVPDQSTEDIFDISHKKKLRSEAEDASDCLIAHGQESTCGVSGGTGDDLRPAIPIMEGKPAGEDGEPAARHFFQHRLGTQWNLRVAVSRRLSSHEESNSNSNSNRTTPSTARAAHFRRLTLALPTPNRKYTTPKSPYKKVKHLITSQELPPPDVAPSASAPLPIIPTHQVDLIGHYTCHGLEPDLFTDFGDTMDKINQDQGCIMYPVGKAEGMIMVGVLDGHGEFGGLVSNMAMRTIALSLVPVAPQLGKSEEKTKELLKQVFEDSDKDLMHHKCFDAIYSGTTAVIALLQGSHLIVAWVGDSRMVLAHRRKGESPRSKVEGTPRSGRCQARALTWDQKPDVPFEMQRIMKSGGFVSTPVEVEGQEAVSRVWLDEEMTQIGLAMSRSLGDHAVATVGVIAEPEITEMELTEKDEFLILATDGVWEFFSNQDAVNFVDKELVEGKTASEACRSLIEEAKHRWKMNEGDYCDDITAVIVKLPLNPEEDTKVPQSASLEQESKAPPIAKSSCNLSQEGSLSPPDKLPPIRNSASMRSGSSYTIESPLNEIQKLISSQNSVPDDLSSSGGLHVTIAQEATVDPH